MKKPLLFNNMGKKIKDKHVWGLNRTPQFTLFNHTIHSLF